MRSRGSSLALLVSACLVAASGFWTRVAAQEFKIEEVPTVATLPISALKPKTIAFTDYRKGEMVDPASGLIRFADWAQARPAQKQVLTLYPGYDEPMVTVTKDGVTKTIRRKLHMYVSEARFEVPRAPSALNPAKYIALPFIERMDSAIKHRTIKSADVWPNKDPRYAAEKNPDRMWCEGAAPILCLQSRYMFEGRLPTGIMLVNKIRESEKQITEYIEFQSELRTVPLDYIDQPTLAKLTGIDGPLTGGIEQSIVWVNQVMQFGKLLALFQAHPTDPAKTIVTAFMVLSVDSELFEKQKQFENVPVLRNLVPSQVLAGNSSFNTGNSISAGLPSYSRNRIKAIAAMLEKE